MDVRQLTRDINAYGARQPAPLTSLKEISGRETEEKANKVFLATLENCQAVLKKRTSVEAELEKFFQSKNIKCQADLLQFYENDADEVAAYYTSRQAHIKINRSEVFSWLVSHADSLSDDSIEMLAKDSRNKPIMITVGEWDFPINQLKAARSVRYFREDEECCELEGVNSDLFELLANWINSRKTPIFTDLSEVEFTGFQQMLAFLGVEDDLRAEVVQENIRRYQLKFKGNTLTLSPGDEVKLAKLHPYFLQNVLSVELHKAGDFLPLLKNLKLLYLTIHHAGDLDPSQLKDFECKFEFVESFPKGIAKVTSNLINFVVREVEDWKDLPSQNFLERVVVENAPMDLQCLKSLKNLTSIHLKSAQLGEVHVLQLCKQNPGLKALHLPKSSIGCAGFAALAALKDLKELHIGSDGLQFHYVVDLPKRGNFFTHKTAQGFGKLEKLTLVKGSLSKDQMQKIGLLPGLKELDISLCTVLDASSLVDLLQIGKLSRAIIPCVGDDRQVLENHLHKHVNSETVVTIL